MVAQSFFSMHTYASKLLAATEVTCDPRLVDPASNTKYGNKNSDNNLGEQNYSTSNLSTHRAHVSQKTRWVAPSSSSSSSFLADGNIFREAAHHTAAHEDARWRRWYGGMEIGYWNALGAILIVVFLGGSIIALRLLFVWHREEHEARRRAARRRRGESAAAGGDSSSSSRGRAIGGIESSWFVLHDMPNPL
ncbi:hypothetical protein PG988_002119 [Apiospora saccharicola]